MGPVWCWSAEVGHLDFIDAVPYVIEILVQSDQNPLDITPCVPIYIFHSGDLLREFREVRGPAKWDMTGYVHTVNPLPFDSTIIQKKLYETGIGLVGLSER